MSRLSKLIGKSRSRISGASAHSPSWFESRRTLSPTVGTAAALYRDPGQVESVYPRLQPFLDEPDVIQAMERDQVPLPGTIDREGYCGDQHLAYWLSGVEDLRMVQRLVPDASFRHVLDFGGASGRFARHIALADESAKVTIADLNVNHIEYVEQHFGPAVRAIKVSPYPYFPLADGSVSFCVGLSVFTHIDCYESGWLAEVHRVMAEGAYALLTIHSEETWQMLPSQSELLKRLLNHPEFKAVYRPGKQMPAGRQVFASNPNSIEHNCNVFVDSDYIHQRWGKWFEIVDIAHRAHHDFQAAVILRKTGPSA
jgi:ubiquinone/menaquinone biosynthesis C-methylase UbiE